MKEIFFGRNHGYFVIALILALFFVIYDTDKNALKENYTVRTEIFQELEQYATDYLKGKDVEIPYEHVCEKNSSSNGSWETIKISVRFSNPEDADFSGLKYSIKADNYGDKISIRRNNIFFQIIFRQAILLILAYVVILVIIVLTKALILYAISY